MLQRYLVLWLLLSSLVAAAWPAEIFDPFLMTKPYLGYLVAWTMFCVGSLLSWQEVRDVGTRWPLVIWGTATQYTAMPLLGYVMARAFHLSPDLSTGVILAGCVPGAMASNVLTMTARGNVSYSVALTTLATILSPLVVPAVLRLTLGTSISPQQLAGSALSLVWQVVLPVLLGSILSWRSGRWRRWSEHYAGVFANLTILWVIAVVVAANRRYLTESSLAVLWPLLGLNLLGYWAGWGAGKTVRMSIPMQRALILEIGMQNAGLGASLALGLFPERPLIALPCGLYAFGCMLTGTILAQWLSTHPVE